MKDEIVLNGIVLSSGLQGEYDRRLVILTREQGKITAFAKGVRRPSSQLISKTQLFVMGAFTVYPGRNAYTLINVDAKEYFHELTFDMNKYCYGSYFCEMMSYFTREGDRSADYLNLLFVSLNALKKGLLPVKLIRCVFDPLSGGILCENCRSKAKKSIHISEDARYVLQYINGATLGNLYNFTVSDSVLEELMMITKEFLAVYVDRKFNSVEIIESLS